MQWTIATVPGAMRFARGPVTPDDSLPHMVWLCAVDAHTVSWAIYATSETIPRGGAGLPQVIPDVASAWAEADVLCHGVVRWDGCMEWWDDGDGMHVCHRSGIDALSTALHLARRNALLMMKDVRHIDDAEEQSLT